MESATTHQDTDSRFADGALARKIPMLVRIQTRIGAIGIVLCDGAHSGGLEDLGPQWGSERSERAIHDANKSIN